MKKRRLTLTCIVCPVGCELQVSVREGKVVSVKGNACPKGEAYAEEEVKPRRTLITVVKVKGSNLPVVSVKTIKPIPKELIPDAMEYLAKIELEAPIGVGDVVVEDLIGLGVPVVATRDAR